MRPWAGTIPAPDEAPSQETSTKSRGAFALWSYSYDDAGNLASQLDARGQRTCLYYDALNRPTGRYYTTGSCPANPTLAVRYSYDAGSLGKGQRTGMTGLWGSTTWAYDARGRVSRETKTIAGSGGGTFTSTWSYNSADQVQSMTYSDGEVVSSGYDPYGRAETLKGTLAGQYTNYNYVSATDYNAFGQPTERLLGNGFSTRWGYWGLGGIGTVPRCWGGPATGGCGRCARTALQRGRCWTCATAMTPRAT